MTEDKNTTTLNIGELTGPELDAAVGEEIMHMATRRATWPDPPIEFCGDPSYFCQDVPHYSTDIAAAWEMEEEIERRGLETEYGEMLYPVIYELWRMQEKPYTVTYAMAHASPELRCRAALMAVREAKEKSE